MQEFWHYLYLNLVIFNQNKYRFNINYNISIFTIPKSELFKPIFLSLDIDFSWAYNGIKSQRYWYQYNSLFLKSKTASMS